MTNEELFEIWAPGGATWSAWAKPVLFAQREMTIQSAAAPAFEQTSSAAGGEQEFHLDAGWVPPAGDREALVIDLPGEQSVRVGLALAGQGYRPVPLYNACVGPAAVVPMERILEWIVRGASHLARLNLPENAPPAFLLDLNRLKGTAAPSPGRFDNRWMTFPQDFPSANFLLAQSIRSVLLVQSRPGQSQEDLAHVLLRWQEAGLSLRVVSPSPAASPQDLEVHRPLRFRWLCHRVLAALGMRRNSAGGFGAVVPHPSAG